MVWKPKKVRNGQTCIPNSVALCTELLSNGVNFSNFEAKMFSNSLYKYKIVTQSNNTCQSKSFKIPGTLCSSFLFIIMMGFLFHILFNVCLCKTALYFTMCNKKVLATYHSIKININISNMSYLTFNVRNISCNQNTAKIWKMTWN